MPDIVRNFMGHVFGLRGDPCNLYSDSRHGTEQNVRCIYIYIYIYITHTHTHIYIYIYIYRERERERERERARSKHTEVYVLSTNQEVKLPNIICT